MVAFVCLSAYKKEENIDKNTFVFFGNFQFKLWLNFARTNAKVATVQILGIYSNLLISRIKCRNRRRVSHKSCLAPVFARPASQPACALFVMQIYFRLLVTKDLLQIMQMCQTKDEYTHTGTESYMLCSSKVRGVPPWPLSAPYKWLITVSACRHRRRINAKTLHIFMNISANAFVFLGNIKWEYDMENLFSHSLIVYRSGHWFRIELGLFYMAVSHTPGRHTIYRELCDMNLHNPSRHKIIIESYSNWFLFILKRIFETVENLKGI